MIQWTQLTPFRPETFLSQSSGYGLWPRLYFRTIENAYHWTSKNCRGCSSADLWSWSVTTSVLKTTASPSGIAGAEFGRKLH